MACSYPEVTILRHPYKGEDINIKQSRCKGVFYKVICDNRGKLEQWAKEEVPVSWIHRSRRGVYHIEFVGCDEGEVGEVPKPNQYV